MSKMPAGRPKRLLSSLEKLERYKDVADNNYDHLKDQALRSYAKRVKQRVKEPIKESLVETYFVREIRRLGGLCLKWSCQGRKGLPDRIIFFPGGHVFFAEVKLIEGKLSISQEREIERLDTLGTHVRVLYGKYGVNEFIREVILVEVPAAIAAFELDADSFYYETDHIEKLRKESYDF